MSVQVRRRREAAAFLSTFVGAQGELLVDTTNNRVQVHDGVTPNGWPAAAIRDTIGHNVGINTNFGINQRAYVSGTALAASVYAHDRHKAGSGGCTYTFTQGVPDTVLTITAGTIIQSIDATNIYVTTYWLTWAGTATARVWQGSASGAFSAGVQTTIDGVTINALLVTGLTIGTIANVEFSTGTLGTTRPWQLEAALPNAMPSRFERRNAGLELVLCQQYFQKSYNPTVGIGSAPGNGSCNVNLNAPSGGAIGDFVLPVTMRAVPTATLYDGTGAAGKVSYYSTSWMGGGTPSVVAPHPGRFFVQTNIAGSSQVNFEYTLNAEV